jgi:hypothetical protein
MWGDLKFDRTCALRSYFVFIKIVSQNSRTMVFSSNIFHWDTDSYFKIFSQLTVKLASYLLFTVIVLLTPLRYNSAMLLTLLSQSLAVWSTLAGRLN